MSFPIEAEAVALAQALQRVDCTADQVHGLTLLDRLLAASIAGVENATDAHWVLVGKLLQAAEAEEVPTCP
jgi:hypothetical protein